MKCLTDFNTKRETDFFFYLLFIYFICYSLIKGEGCNVILSLCSALCNGNAT